MSGLEIAVSALLSVVLAFTCIESVQQKAKTTELVFDFGLLTISALMLLGSSLLLAGLFVGQERLMYFTIFVRATLLVFMSAFGVNQFVLTDDNERPRGPGQEAAHFQRQEREYSGETPIILRLIGLIVLMIASLGGRLLFDLPRGYTAIRFVFYSRHLKDRRESLLIASHIEPELLAHLRRQSHASKTSS
ncbi:hypothetical protein M3Y99_00789400 [Aphelenchoides fujianensis]|nr:hypothetical protein M3Y99_00789400 [Aphelenchoides fujianensis]